jgi:flagellar M-ring protein FliF
MKDQILAFGQRIWADFRAFSPGQKAVTVLAGLALLVGGILFATWKTSPQYAPLYTNLAASDASAIVDKLNAAAVPYKLDAAGTEILVPQDKVYSTRLTVSAAGLPASGQSGYDLLDKEGVTTSEFKQQVDFQRAVQGELGTTIQSIGGVQSATVQLAIPQQNVFNDGSQKPKAAVMLTLAPGTQLTSQQVQSVVYLVSSSVPDMSADDVTVTDASGDLLAAPGQGVSGTAGTDAQTAQVADYNSRKQAQLEALLTPLVGAGHAVVTVDADLNFDKINTTQHIYTDPKTPPINDEKKQESYNGGQGNGGTLGAGTPAGSGTSNGNGTYNSTTETQNNALNEMTRTIDSAPGAVNKLAIGVLLDSSVKGIDVARITNLIKSASGYNASRGDSLSIQAMTFDQSAAKAAAAQSKAAANAAAAKAAKDRMTSLVKQGALAIGLLALVIGTWLASRRRRRSSPPPNDDLGLFHDEPVTDLTPALPQPSPMAAELQEAAARRNALVALAEQQPKDVATVLSGWLSNGKDSDLINTRSPR